MTGEFPVAGKLSYEGLEQRVKELETDCLLLRKSNEILSDKELESNAFLNALTETAVLVESKDLNFISCNKVAADRVGKTVEEIIGLSLSDVMSEKDYEVRKQYSEQVTKTGKPARFITRSVFASKRQTTGSEKKDEEGGNGDEGVYDISIYPVFDSQGNVNRLAIYSQDVTDRLRAEKELKESEERYRNLVALSPDAIGVIQDSQFILINPEFTRLSGYDQEDIEKGLNYLETVSKQDKQVMRERFTNRLEGKDVSPHRAIMDFVAKDGDIIPCETASSLINYKGRPAVLVIIRDITERKKAEIELKAREEELKSKATDLEEVNAALKVLLKHRDEDKAEIEERVLSNIQTLILPFLEKLKNRGLDKKQVAYANILEANLNDIISPLSRRLSLRHLKFTPAEIQISNLIKQGRTSKEIAELLNLSERTIESHRKNIRRKTGIKNKKENLRTYLLNIYNE